jgi:hypothetical protein
MWRASGIKPQALTRKPRLNESDRYFYEAFWQLSPSRGRGDAFGPIPQDQYLSYWLSYGITGINERWRFQSVVSMLDRDYVEHVDKKRKDELDRMKAKNSGGGRGGGGRPG